MHTCVRCPTPAAALMMFDYAERAVWLTELDRDPREAKAYPLCTPHADRLTPPLGWTLTDRRNVTRLFSPGVESPGVESPGTESPGGTVEVA